MFRNPSKRQRDYEELPAYSEEFVREKKKHRSLPLRSPRTPGQRIDILDANQQNCFSACTPSALTPIESPNDENPYNKLAFPMPTPGDQQCLDGMHDFGADCDTPMDVDVSEGSGLTRADIISHQSPSARYGATLKTSLQEPSLLETAAEVNNSPGMPGELPGNALWWRCPRLPSPVSDNGDSITGTKDTSDDAEMVDEVSPPDSNSATGSGSSSAMEAEAADVRQRLSSLDLPGRTNMGPTSSIKPYKKLGFSMGYRADCDKCRRKVPGHYSHIIAS
ncbi:hypothetical protein BDV18DRAFT_100411 [Aspergillus unguis]